MRSPLLEYLELSLGMDAGYVKVASYLDTLSQEDTALLYEAIQDGTFEREATDPKTKLAEARGRLFARHEFRKQAAAAGYTPDAIMGEAIDSLTGGSNLDASLRRVGELRKTAMDPEAQRRTKRDMRALSVRAGTSGAVLGGLVGGGALGGRISGKGALIGAGTGALAGLAARGLKNLSGTKERIGEAHTRNVLREKAMGRMAGRPHFSKAACRLPTELELRRADLEKQAGLAGKALGWLGNLAKGSKATSTALAKTVPKAAPEQPTSYLGNVWKGFKDSGRSSFANPIQAARGAAAQHAPGAAGGPSNFANTLSMLKKRKDGMDAQYLGQHLGQYKGLATYGAGGALAAKGALGGN